MIKKNPHRTNREIRTPNVRLVGDNIGDADIVELEDAIKMAEAQELDLVEISPKADPPVCRILNYQKFLYDQKKKQKEIKANQSKVTQKEIRFGPNTDDHDFNFKVKHARKFLRRATSSRHTFSSEEEASCLKRGERFCCCALRKNWKMSAQWS